MSNQSELGPWACDPAQSRGRRFAEEPAPTRTEFQRDRDRIVHSTAFRRLVYKTQVFLNHEGDLFRTRLTHSLEVAQLARSIARSVHLNEDLVEAISLAHDLGHTPFGHAGQEALNDCMADFGGFEHNLQSLRVVDHLEERYPRFNGLNLCFETREGILKHCSTKNASLLEQAEPLYPDGEGGVGHRFLRRTQPSMEAQLCNLADEIAYNAHDIDDGVRSGLIDMGQLRDVPLFNRYLQETLEYNPHLATETSSRRLLYDAIRRMLSAQVYDVIAATQSALATNKAISARTVKALPPLVSFGKQMRNDSLVLKQFLFRELYRHPRVVGTMDRAQQVVRDLFKVYARQPDEMQSPRANQSSFVRRVDALDEKEAMRGVADYIAGMTDRFAVKEHERLTGQRVLS